MTDPLISHHPERSLPDRAYDFLGEMLLQAETEEMLREIEAETNAGDTAEMDAFFARQDQLNLKKIQKHFRKQHNKQLLTRTLPKVAQVAAALIILVALAGSVAIATSHTMRVHMMNLLYEMDEEYSTLRMVEDKNASFDVPAQWQGTCYPSRIPAEWELFNVLSFSTYHSVEYRDRESQQIVLRFSEYEPDIEINIDTEDSIVREIALHESNGFLVEKNGQISIYWSNGLHYYMLVVSSIGADEAIQIANSVISIR